MLNYSNAVAESLNPMVTSCSLIYLPGILVDMELACLVESVDLQDCRMPADSRETFAAAYKAEVFPAAAALVAGYTDTRFVYMVRPDTGKHPSCSPGSIRVHWGCSRLNLPFLTDTQEFSEIEYETYIRLPHKILKYIQSSTYGTSLSSKPF